MFDHWLQRWKLTPDGDAIITHVGLSAAWFLEDEERDRADVGLQVARLAQQALAQWALVNGNA